MKKILFISRSGLSHNLLRAVLPLVPVKTDLECLDSMEGLNRLPNRGKSFALAIIDFNAFSTAQNLEGQLAQLTARPTLKEARFILIHAHHTEANQGLLGAHGFTGFHTKPFLPEELGEIITQSLTA